MARQHREFTCVITDKQTGDVFSAFVELEKQSTINASRIDPGKIELADIYVWALVGAVHSGPTIKPDGKDGITTSIKYKGAKSHFVLYDHAGNGKYVRRDKDGHDLEKRICSIWDLGNPFGRMVTQALTELM